MIPKIIHYCWFSYSEIPGLAEKMAVAQTLE